MIIFISTLIGVLFGIIFPLIVALISHLKHKKKYPNKPDTASGAISLVLPSTFIGFGFFGFFIGIGITFYGAL